MTYAQACTYIDGRVPRGMVMGLERMRTLLQACGDPQERLRAVHVAGTNGKGSTARMIQAVATAAGYRTGLFSSPAVLGRRSSIAIDGQAITEAAYAEGLAALQQAETTAGVEATSFELETALAFWYFAQQGCDLCVVECGLGGRDDATNVLPPPLAAVLTPVALDHMALLGPTVETIASNKCAIVKAPCTAVCSPMQDPAALGVLLETAARQGVRVRVPGIGAAPIREADWGRLRFTYNGLDLTVPLTGAFQRDNALTAIETLYALEEKGYRFPPAAFRDGLAAATMPCRQEVIGRAPLRVLDGAHNPHGVAALTASMRAYSPGARWTLLIGMLRDKQTQACAALLAPLCPQVVCCTPPNARALPAAELAAAFPPGAAVQALPDPAAALTAAQTLAGGGPLLMAGSFYLGAVLRPILARGMEKSGN